MIAPVRCVSFMDGIQFRLQLDIAEITAQNKKLVSLQKRVFNGGDKRDRTADLLNAIQALSSYKRVANPLRGWGECFWYAGLRTHFVRVPFSKE